MIERYQDSKIKRIWSEDHRFFLWQKIELIYLNNILKNKNIIPHDEKLYPLEQFDHSMFFEYEKRTKHEMVAFLKELSYRLDIYHEKYPEVNQYLHYGLTSSDIIDTAFSLQIKESLNYLIELITELKAAIETKIKFCKENNIQTRVTFAGNVTRHPVYREYLQDFNNADTIMKNGFLLGAHHGMTIEDVDYVCDKVKEFFNR